MPRKLKVFRTPIGFHDAYVAVPTQKAALEAWGADRNLFARGVAEQVDDPALMAEPLAKPGEVIRRLRDMPPDQPAPSRRKKARAEPPASAARKPPKPRPSRTKIDAAEEAIAALTARQKKEVAALDREQALLDRKRARLARDHQDALAALEAERDAAAAAYHDAVERWED